jgi:hypothetical protein
VQFFPKKTKRLALTLGSLASCLVGLSGSFSFLSVPAGQQGSEEDGVGLCRFGRPSGAEVHRHSILDLFRHQKGHKSRIR